MISVKEKSYQTDHIIIQKYRNDLGSNTGRQTYMTPTNRRQFLLPEAHPQNVTRQTCYNIKLSRSEPRGESPFGREDGVYRTVYGHGVRNAYRDDVLSVKQHRWTYGPVTRKTMRRISAQIPPCHPRRQCVLDQGYPLRSSDPS